MLYCPNFFWNVLQVWMTGKDVYLQMTWSWPDKTWNILCSYCLQWNTSQSKFRNHYFLFLFAFSILSQLFLIWGCINIHDVTGLYWILNCRTHANIHIVVIRCIFNCCFHTAVSFLCLFRYWEESAQYILTYSSKRRSGAFALKRCVCVFFSWIASRGQLGDQLGD